MLHFISHRYFPFPSPQLDSPHKKIMHLKQIRKKKNVMISTCTLLYRALSWLSHYSYVKCCMSGDVSYISLSHWMLALDHLNTVLYYHVNSTTTFEIALFPWYALAIFTVAVNYAHGQSRLFCIRLADGLLLVTGWQPVTVIVSLLAGKT